MINLGVEHCVVWNHCNKHDDDHQCSVDHDKIRHALNWRPPIYRLCQKSINKDTNDMSDCD